MGATLMGNVVFQPQTTPEFEEKLVYDQAQKPVAPLSIALKELIAGVLDQTFDEAFFKKIETKEKENFTGEYTDYWKNGQLKIQANFINGKVDGHVHGWFPDGLEAFKAFYYENKKVGIHMVFYPSGGPEVYSMRFARLFCFDFNGQLDREQIAKYRTGRLKSSIEYKHSVKEGSHILWNADEVRIKDEKYGKGKLLKMKPK